MIQGPDSEFEINRYIFVDDKIKEPKSFAVIADLHNCTFGADNRRLLDAIDNESPDGILIAGDLIEGSRFAEETVGLKLLYDLSRKYPVYYGVGNHEKRIMDGQGQSRQKRQLVYGLKRCGVKLIHNKSYDIGSSGIVIKGLDIPHKYYRRVIHKKTTGAELEGWLKKNDEDKFSILLAHDPSHFKAYADYGADLVLSGHVHGGIIRLPIVGGLLSPEYKPFPKYDAGIYERKGTRMLVSRGLGSHTINFRINNAPELIMLRLCNGNDRSQA